MISRKKVDRVCERYRGKFYFVKSKLLVDIAREVGRSIKRIAMSDGYYYNAVRYRGTTFASKTSAAVGNGIKVMTK